MRLPRALGLQLSTLLWFASLVVTGCGGPALDPKPPAFEPKDQTKCGVTKSQAHPLIVEWPSADRAALEAHAKRGLVAVRYVGCEMELVPQCKVPGAYGYSALTRKRDRVSVRDVDDLYAKMPVGAARLEAALQKSGELNVSMTIVGRYEADRLGVREEELSGDCAEATHVVTALTTGAFELFAGADASAGGGVEVAGAGVGAQSRSTRESLNQDGEAASCDQSGDDDKRPPAGCGALLRVDVVPITRTARTEPPVEAALPSNPPPAAPRVAAAPGKTGSVRPPRPSGGRDQDGDGIPDDADKCPSDPEDKDGFQDEDGCPDPDNDGDRIPDARDKCPNEPETFNGSADSDGCPDG